MTTATAEPTYLSLTDALARLAGMIRRGLISEARGTEARQAIERNDGCHPAYLTHQAEASQGIYVGHPVDPAIGSGRWFTRQQAETLVGWVVTIVNDNGGIIAGAEVIRHHVAPFGDHAGVLTLKVAAFTGETIIDVKHLGFVYAIAPARNGHAPVRTSVVLGEGASVAR